MKIPCAQSSRPASPLLTAAPSRSPRRATRSTTRTGADGSAGGGRPAAGATDQQPLAHILLNSPLRAARASRHHWERCRLHRRRLGDTDRTEPRRHDRQRLHRRRAVGAVRVRGRHLRGRALDPVCRLVRRRSWIVYFFGESIVASAVFNFTDWLRGDGGFVENLVDFGVDVGLAFVWLGLDALNYVHPAAAVLLLPAAAAGAGSVPRARRQ